MIKHISAEKIYRKNAEQYGKFYPYKLYADVEKLVLNLGHLQIPPGDEEPRIIPFNLKESSDEKIINIWRLARKVFAVRNHNFLDDVANYVYHTRLNP